MHVKGAWGCVPHFNRFLDRQFHALDAVLGRWIVTLDCYSPCSDKFGTVATENQSQFACQGPQLCELHSEMPTNGHGSISLPQEQWASVSPALQFRS